MINLLGNTPNQPTKFRRKNQVEINDESRGNYNTVNQTRFKPSMLNSSLCYYSNVDILVRGTITIAIADIDANNTNKKGYV